MQLLVDCQLLAVVEQVLVGCRQQDDEACEDERGDDGDLRGWAEQGAEQQQRQCQ